MINLFAPFIAPDAIDNVRWVLNSGQLAQGQLVAQFEQLLSAAVGAPVLTTNSGTSALHLAYDVCGIRKGTWVISTPMTCLATNLPLLHLGANIMWADVGQNGNIDPEDVRRILKEGAHEYEAVVCVDYGGIPCDYSALRDICDEFGVFLIQDAAQSLGATWDGKPMGKVADVTAFSFQAIKLLTTGDGGALTCRLPGHFEEAKLKRWFGLDRTKGGFRCEQDTEVVGYKFHMNEIAAAIGIANVVHVDRLLEKQRTHAFHYAAELVDVVPFAKWDDRADPAFWLFTLLVPDRQRFIQRMQLRGVQCARPHDRNDEKTIFSASRRVLRGVTEFDKYQVAIPVRHSLEPAQVELIVQAVKDSLI